MTCRGDQIINFTSFICLKDPSSGTSWFYRLSRLSNHQAEPEAAASVSSLSVSCVVQWTYGGSQTWTAGRTCWWRKRRRAGRRRRTRRAPPPPTPVNTARRSSVGAGERLPSGCGDADVPPGPGSPASPSLACSVWPWDLRGNGAQSQTKPRLRFNQEPQNLQTHLYPCPGLHVGDESTDTVMSWSHL